MPSNHQTLGRCPRCDEQIHRSHLLIEYDTSSGPGVFAECPGCLDVVAPI